MTIIDRYVIRQVVAPLLLGLLVFTFIFIIPLLIEYAEVFIAKGVPAPVVAQIILTLVPQALGVSIPMSLLLGLLVGFGRLSADREFVAMQACGISLWRLLRPVGLVSVACWAATSYVLLVALPSSNQRFREITFDIVAQRAEGEVRPRVFFEDFPNLVLYVREIPPSGAGWQGVFIVDMRRDPPSTYVARRGRVLIDRQKQTVEMVLDEVFRHTADQSGKYDVSRSERVVLSVDPSTIFPREGPMKGENEMTVAELQARAAEVAALGRSPHNYLMAIHRKFSIPVACLVFGLIGLALGASKRRDGALGSFVLGLIVIFAYYVPLYLGPNLARGGLVPAWLAVWLPNLILGALGVALFLRRDRVADQPIRLPLPRALERRLSGASRPALVPRLPMLTLLDRYVALKYGRVLALSAAGLAGVFYISTFIDLSDEVLKGQATWRMLAEYFWFATPQYVYYVLPLSVLMATLATVAILTKNSELVVMKACGISLYRIAVPMVFAAAIAGGVLFALEETILGPSNRRAEAIRHVIRGGDPAVFDILNRRWVTGTDGDIYHYAHFDPRAGRLSGLSVYEFSDGMRRIARRTYAEVATYQPAGDGRSRGTWRVERGWTREFDEAGEPVSYTSFTERREPFESAEYFGTEQPEPKFMSYTELRDYIARLQAGGFDVLAQQVALARKVSFPFVTLVMTMIAVPFAVTIGRSGAMAGIGVGIGLALVYWTAISVFAALGAGGLIAPALAAWAPNILFGSAAVYLLLTVRT